MAQKKFESNIEKKGEALEDIEIYMAKVKKSIEKIEEKIKYTEKVISEQEKYLKTSKSKVALNNFTKTLDLLRGTLESKITPGVSSPKIGMDLEQIKKHIDPDATSIYLNDIPTEKLKIYIEKYEQKRKDSLAYKNIISCELALKKNLGSLSKLKASLLQLQLRYDEVFFTCASSHGSSQKTVLSSLVKEERETKKLEKESLDPTIDFSDSFFKKTAKRKTTGSTFLTKDEVFALQDGNSEGINYWNEQIAVLDRLHHQEEVSDDELKNLKAHIDNMKIHIDTVKNDEYSPTYLIPLCQLIEYASNIIQDAPPVHKCPKL